MKAAAGILCWNQDQNDRADLFELCYKSLHEAQPDLLVVADNGSTDDTRERVKGLGGIRFPTVEGFPHGNTCGYGMTKLARTLAPHGDILILSNDDIVWSGDTVDRLRAIWAEAPDEVKIISGLVEPLFALPGQEPWNLVYGKTAIAGETVWLRKSVPGGAWTFRAEDVPLIFPVSTFPGTDDVPACKKLAEKGYAVGCVDLAEHAGIGKSSWGNASHEQLMVASVAEWQAEFA